MKWSMDTHKYMSELTRKALQILAENHINSTSEPDAIENAERKLAEAGVYKDFDGAKGRIKRALFTYFKAYDCMDTNCNLTEVGKAYVENKLSLQEFSFYYVANYVYKNEINKYYPLQLILKCLFALYISNPANAYLTAHDFSKIVDCDNLDQVNDAFVAEIETAHTQAPVEVDERECGYDVWAKMLDQAGILVSTNNTLRLTNPALASWILESYGRELSYQRGSLRSGILEFIPIVPTGKGKGRPSDCATDGLLLQAFLFDNIPENIIRKYITVDSNHSMAKMCKVLGLTKEQAGYYSAFSGLERLVGRKLFESCTGLQKAIGEMLLNLDVSTNKGLEDVEPDDIFSGFEPWLTSYNNPDYTGKQKYNGYPRAILKLVEFMFAKGLIDDSNLNDLDVDKFYTFQDAYNASDETKEFDQKKLGSGAGIAALKKYTKYIEYLLSPHIDVFDYSATASTGKNKIFFGTPGCGKSYHIEHNILGKSAVSKKYEGSYEKDNIIRTTFYQDYSNTDFVGQILPKVVRGEDNEKDTVEYIFNPGPFTLALIQAISNPTKKVALVIEEINRGNAPAIFGDIFQLLDRDGDSISEYGIVNVGLMDYLNNYEFVADGQKKRYKFKEIKIPGNMDIFATMNTSDQNVYTLDTAFVRRWEKEKIKNTFAKCTFRDKNVPGMGCTWQKFVEDINACIASHLEDLQVNEDKQIGAFFVNEALLSGSAEKFAYKVFDYLWNDVAKLDREIFFNHYDTLDALIAAYIETGVAVFKPGVFK